MSGSRGIFYDKCNDATKLARDWTLISESGNWSCITYYDSPFHTYQLTDSLGGTRLGTLVLQSQRPSGNLEVYFKFKKLATIVGGAGCIALNYSRRSTTDRYYITLTDNVYIYRQEGAVHSGTFYGYPGGVISNDVWYEFKVRLFNNKVKIKWWLLGTSEPDWLIDSSGTGSGGSERPMRQKRSPGSSYFALGAVSFAVGNYLRYADIRITPVRKVGGL